MFSLFRKKPVNFFSPTEQQTIVQAIEQAELQTSGEIRVYIEATCATANALDRAKALFAELNMHQTAQQNAVLVYVALNDRKLAVFGDEGIHQKLGNTYWHEVVENALFFFNKKNYAIGIADIVKAIGEALKTHFPYDKKTDVNELPNDIVFGK